MPEHVVSAVLRLIEIRVSEGLERLEIEFFGGEPLAAWDVLSRIAETASTLCEATGTEFIGGITTNATLLTPVRLDAMVSWGVRNFQITLDGPPEIHNARRRSANGNPSFSSVWNSLETIKSAQHAVDVLVRLHYDPTSLPYLIGEGGFVARVVSSLLTNDARFRLFLQPLTRLGGDRDREIVVFQGGDGRKALQLLIDDALKAGAQSDQLPQHGQGSLGESGLAICYAARANAFVIRSNGDVSKCTVAFGDARNAIGRLGPNGELDIDHELHMPWLAGLLSGEPEKLSCPAVHVIWNESGTGSPSYDEIRTSAA
jgi:uncharacterized protein